MPLSHIPRQPAHEHVPAPDRTLLPRLRVYARRAAWCAMLAITIALVPAAAASAVSWRNEAEMVASVTGRDTFVADPGRDKKWDRADLIAEHGTYFRERGFGNVLTWAPKDTYRPSAGATWGGCGPSGVQIGWCPGTRGPLHQNLVSAALTEDRTITALVWDDAFIALACGNFSGRTTAGPNPPSIAGKKFEDVDGDGARGSAEPGLEGWVIELYQGGRRLDSTTTNANGDYRFVLNANTLDIRSETFELREVQKPGWAASRAPEPVRVPFGTHDARTYGGNDFGNYRPATIEGVKFDDHDVDRTQDANEGGLAGWTIALSGGRSADATNVTDADGRYAFTGLAPGRYDVAETMQPGWRQSAPASGTHAVTVRSGDTVTRDFGNVCLGSSRVDITEESGAVLPGVEVRIEEIAVTGVLANEPPLPRTTSGTPAFGDLLPGTYRVIAFLPDGVYTSDPDLTAVEGRLAVVKEITVAECETTTVPIETFTTSSGKVTGGRMNMENAAGSSNAGFVFMTRNGRAEGSLEFQDRAAELNLHTKQIEQILVRDNEAWIGGLVEVDGAMHRFSLHLVDNGEPGADDRFELLLDTGYRAGFERTIDGGNVQIHPPARR